MNLEEYGYIIHKEVKNHVFVLGNKKFTPLDMTVKNGQNVELEEKVYFGNDKRNKIENIERWLTENEFLLASKTAVTNAIKKIILENENYYINFLNNFALEEEIKRNTLQKAFLLGEKTLEKIIIARQTKPFASFDDVKERTRIGTLLKTIVNKIYNEISGTDKCRFFANKAKSND